MTQIEAFLSALHNSAFSGDIGDDLATRLVGATDNSIYRMMPDAIVFPRSANDMQLALHLAALHQVSITARGGGTGTNGQSLNAGVVIDTSRFMTKILRFDAERRVVVVEPGVVLDQLNRFLAPHGLFFPPTVSTSSRATLGGMFATDASGKGSRRYGRMSDWVVHADVLLANGQACDSGSLPGAADIVADLKSHEASITESFPDMNRSLTGYNLRDARQGDGLNGVKLLAGSEGTLALTTKLTLRVEALPKCKGLAVLAYRDCLAALDHVPELLAADPVAIEFLDDKIIDLAARTPMWSELQAIFGATRGARGFLFVEFAGNSAEDLATGFSQLTTLLENPPAAFISRTDTVDAGQMTALWETRKRAVGLLGAMEGARVGVPFVEDAAVPPENLTRFVQGFRDILNDHGLDYGMFGHADVGCVHVRPALDMRDPQDRARIRDISDRVAGLARDLGGLIWGEHGKGLRGEYLPLYLPEDLCAVAQRIKQRFDPDERLNPGKLVSLSKPVLQIDDVPLRGARDQDIDDARFGVFSKSVGCNGNGACFNWAPDDPMCPSYKATGDKRLSPKGRATLFREWTRANSLGEDSNALGQALYSSLQHCLSCNSCTSQCPVAVNIPEMKSHFLDRWYATRPRPLRDRLVQRMEAISLIARRVPKISNVLLQTRIATSVLARNFGLVDVPGFSGTTVEKILKKNNIPPAQDPRSRVDLCLVLDSVTAPYGTDVLDGVLSLLRALNLKVAVTPVLPTGKAAQVRGYLANFERTRRASETVLNNMVQENVPLVSLEPAITHLLQREYHREDVLSLDKFLAQHLNQIPRLVGWCEEYVLFLHCTEKTADPATGQRWQKIFDAAGLRLRLQQTGCCGMAGLFGHEAEHKTLSQKMFNLSWADPIAEAGHQALVTGFSCRSQAKRFAGLRTYHPAQALANHLKRNAHE